MNPKELRSARQQILDRASDAGDLSDVARVLARYVYHLAPDCYFEPLDGKTSEWVLRPRNWIDFYLSTGRGGYDPKITISIDAYKETFRGDTAFEMKPGRKPSWSKFTITNVGQIKDAIHLITETHRLSGR